MKSKIALGVLVATLAGTGWADESHDQLNLKLQKAERRIEDIERSAARAKESAQELRKQVARLSEDGRVQQKNVLSLSERLAALEERHASLVGSLEQLDRKTEHKTRAIGHDLDTRTMWYGVAFAFLLMVLGGAYWYLQRRHVMSEKSLSAKVKGVFDTVRSTEEKMAKSDKELADSLFEILGQLKAQAVGVRAATTFKSEEPDHGLPLKLADEIHRMRKRLALLPEETKGLTPLQKSLERLTSELAEQGYEIIDHVGMAYTENLSVKARFVPSDELGDDQKIISKVVVPQVNYKGVMIRMADIEVSIGS